MTSNPIDPARTALLVLDHQAMLVQGYATDPLAHLNRVAAVLARARDAGMGVLYVTVGFRPGYPEVSDNNKMFCGVRDGKRFQLGDAQAQIPVEIAPLPNEPVVVKRRVSGFAGTDLEMLLRARGVDTLVMFGIATSGVVTSTVRAAADLDYRLIVIKDICLDLDQDLHETLVEKLFPKQAEVITVDDFVSCMLA